MVSPDEDDVLNILNSFPYGIAILQDERIVFYNRSLTSMHGYTQDDMKGKTILDFLHPEDKEAYIRRLEKRKKGEPLREDVIFRTLHKNGSVLLIKISTHVINFKGKKSVLAIVHNIGSSSFLYQPLDILSSLMDSLAFHNSIGIWVDDLSDNTIYANQFLCDVLDVTPNEIVNHKVTDFLHPDSKKIYLDKMLERKKNIQTDTYELTLINRDGRPLYFKVIGSVLFDFEGNKIGSVGLFFNIEELKKSSSILQLLNKCFSSAFIDEHKRFWSEILSRLCGIFYSKYGLIVLEGEILATEGHLSKGAIFGDCFDILMKEEEEKEKIAAISKLFNVDCKSYYSSLLYFHNSAAGFIVLASTIPRLFTKEDKELISFFASQIGLLYEYRIKTLRSEEERSFASLLLDILSHDFVNANTSVFGYLELLRESLKTGS
ncbi:MAG: PAS domain S-box protein, partial [Candidatus Heimdallarchaeaceae archaeon]